MPTPTFFLEGIVRERDEAANFEGPLSVILMLLSRNKVEIRDIQISLILDQYLEFIARLEEMDLEVASEFVQMASHLLYIKTAMLLKTEEEVSELELLIETLEQFRNRENYGRIKQVTPELGKSAEQGFLLHVRGREPIKTVPDYAYRHEGVELLMALRSVFSRGSGGALVETPTRLVPQRIVYNVREKSREIILWLRQAGPVCLRDIFMKSESRTELVATFVSVLELCADGNLSLTETEDGIMAEFTGGADIEAILEAIGENDIEITGEEQ